MAVRRKVWLSSLWRNLFGLWLCVALSSEMNWVVSAGSVFQWRTAVSVLTKPNNDSDGVCCSYWGHSGLYARYLVNPCLLHIRCFSVLFKGKSSEDAHLKHGRKCLSISFHRPWSTGVIGDTVCTAEVQELRSIFSYQLFFSSLCS